MIQQIWDLKTYKLKTDLAGHSDGVYCVDFVADKIVSGGRDRTVKMYVFFLQYLGRV
jgi:ribosome assembly protein 4